MGPALYELVMYLARHQAVIEKGNVAHNETLLESVKQDGDNNLIERQEKNLSRFKRRSEAINALIVKAEKEQWQDYD